MGHEGRPHSTAARVIAGTRIPTFVYGTAWKEERTAELVCEALAAGFRGLDTANQRRHYNEAAVGEALSRAGVARKDIFLQTKFTYRAGQDHRLPYDPHAPIASQVVQSFDSSLVHLDTDAIDSYLLHGPAGGSGWGADDVEAWGAMESLYDAGRVKYLGVSNVAREQLEALLRIARVRPMFVQNRCFALLGWDAAVRGICEREGLVYQAFSLLTANRQFLGHPIVGAVARAHERTPSQIVFRFALDIGMIPLTGTSDRRHMAEDLEVYEFHLSDDECTAIEGVAGQSP
jgi:diketogulonate reductase-like aldo/keto reductase